MRQYEMKIVSNIAGIIAALCMAGMTVLLLAEIALRPFGILVPSANDFATYLMIGVAFFGFVHAFEAGAHVRVDLVYRHLPAGVQQAVECLSLAIAAVLLAALTYGAGHLAWTAYRFHDVSDTLIPIPMVVPLGAATLGLGLFALVAAMSAYGVVRGRSVVFAISEKDEALALAQLDEADGSKA